MNISSNTHFLKSIYIQNILLYINDLILKHSKFELNNYIIWIADSQEY